MNVNTQHSTAERKEWQAYLEGDNMALSSQYSRYRPSLLLIAYNYLRNTTAAQDVVHDVFERLLSSPKNERKHLFAALTSNPGGFLHVVVRNKCLDEMKVLKNREKIVGLIRHTFKLHEENTAYDRFEKDYFNTMLSNLEPREKEIIELHLSGFGNDEISTKLNISYNSVKNNIYEAKKKLRKVWKVMHG